LAPRSKTSFARGGGVILRLGDLSNSSGYIFVLTGLILADTSESNPAKSYVSEIDRPPGVAWKMSASIDRIPRNQFVALGRSRTN
jgi:hypothetical protein